MSGCTAAGSHSGPASSSKRVSSPAPGGFTSASSPCSAANRSYTAGPMGSAPPSGPSSPGASPSASRRPVAATRRWMDHSPTRDTISVTPIRSSGKADEEFANRAAAPHRAELVRWMQDATSGVRRSRTTVTCRMDGSASSERRPSADDGDVALGGGGGAGAGVDGDLQHVVAGGDAGEGEGEGAREHLARRGLLDPAHADGGDGAGEADGLGGAADGAGGAAREGDGDGHAVGGAPQPVDLPVEGEAVARGELRGPAGERRRLVERRGTRVGAVQQQDVGDGEAGRPRPSKVHPEARPGGTAGDGLARLQAQHRLRGIGAQAEDSAGAAHALGPRHRRGVGGAHYHHARLQGGGGAGPRTPAGAAARGGAGWRLSAFIAKAATSWARPSRRKTASWCGSGAR